MDLRGDPERERDCDREYDLRPGRDLVCDLDLDRDRDLDFDLERLPLTKMRKLLKLILIETFF